MDPSVLYHTQVEDGPGTVYFMHFRRVVTNYHSLECGVRFERAVSKELEPQDWHEPFFNYMDEVKIVSSGQDAGNFDNRAFFRNVKWTGDLTLPVNGNCPRCHHYHKDAMIAVYHPSDINKKAWVKCQNCHKDWFSFADHNLPPKPKYRLVRQDCSVRGRRQTNRTHDKSPRSVS